MSRVRETSDGPCRGWARRTVGRYRGYVTFFGDGRTDGLGFGGGFGFGAWETGAGAGGGGGSGAGGGITGAAATGAVGPEVSAPGPVAAGEPGSRSGSGSAWHWVSAWVWG